jgi:type IV pilus assembly protein PilB
VQRLLDLGMQANSLASELLAVIAQRLVKRICPACRAEAEPDPAILKELFPGGAPDDFVCFEGLGCDECEFHGHHGRIAVTEFLRTGPTIRKAIAEGVTVDQMRELAGSAELYQMRTSALDLVRQGVIALDEIPRVLSEERMAPQR